MAAIETTIFISYSHKDRKFFDEFNTMLAPAVRGGRLDPWHDQKLAPGALWEEEIEKALQSAQIAVLLVSPNFLASHFIADRELAPLLDAARQKGLVIFWIYCSACMYEQTEIASYQAAHNIARPLDMLSKPERQGVLSAVCAKLLKVVESGSAALSSGKVAKSAAPANGKPPRRLECCVLLSQALRCALQASYGMGPTTALHRQARLAKQWLDKAARLWPESRQFYVSDLAEALDQASLQTLPSLLAWLPDYGAFEEPDRDRQRSADYKRVQRQTDLLGEEIDKYIKDDPELAAFRESDQGWAVLGFRDEEDFKDYLYPSLKRVAENPDPMQRDLLERLAAGPVFTIHELHRAGYRKDIVMDSVNALMAEKWAQWKREEREPNFPGREGPLPTEYKVVMMTDVGLRLLKQLLTSGSAGLTGSRNADHWYPRS